MSKRKPNAYVHQCQALYMNSQKMDSQLYCSYENKKNCRDMQIKGDVRNRINKLMIISKSTAKLSHPYEYNMHIFKINK